MLSYYKQPSTVSLDVEFLVVGGLSKFTAVKDIDQAYSDLFAQYQYIMLIDDDLLFEFSDVDRAFFLVSQFNLALAQPSLTGDSFYSWKITLEDPAMLLRYTNYVEIMMPIFSRDAFRACVGTFAESVSAWGLDEVWPHVIGDTHRNIAILDAVKVKHTRPMDVLRGPFYQYLAGLGIDPEVERQDIHRRYHIGHLKQVVHAGVTKDNGGEVLSPWTKPGKIVLTIDDARELIRVGDLAEAESIYGMLVQKFPREPLILKEYCWLLLRRHKMTTVVIHVDRLERLGVDVAFELSKVALTYMHMCDWSQIEVIHARLSRYFDSGLPSIIDMYMVLAIVDDPVEHLAAAHCVSAKIASHVQRLPKPQKAKITAIMQRRLRIGYLCGTFHNHPMSLLMAGVIERHDRACFDVIAYDFSAEDGSPVRARMVNAFEHFVRLGSDGPSKCARRIAADHLDVLVDLMGYTEGTRSEIMALRPAPVQVNFLGYAGTQAAGWIDFVIADHHVLPRSERSYWPEKVVRMPNTYYPGDCDRAPVRPPYPQGRAAHGLPSEGFVFVCFNNSYKITQEIFLLWMRILKAVPRSVLWLYQGNPYVARNLRIAASKMGIGAARLVFAPPMAQEAHLDRHVYADLFLDTLPYGAHTTATDALWAGLPLLTLRGRSFASRVGTSLLHAIGIPEMICETPVQYIELAVALARDKERLQRVRQEFVRSRGTSPLFDTLRYTADLERAYLLMATAKYAGTPLVDIDL